MTKNDTLKSIPVESRTYDACKNAVISNPYTIKDVPVEMLTGKFIDELNMYGIIIPKKYLNYVHLCIKANNNAHIENQVKANSIPKEIASINLHELSNILSLHTINLINQYNIYTLGELINVVDNEILCLKYFGLTSFYDEIVNTIKLLKCLYLNEDPKININDEQECNEDFFKSLGIRVLSDNFLSFWDNTSIKEFFIKIQDPNVQKELSRVRNFGTLQVNSLITRANIILDYYKKNPNKLPSESSSEENVNEILKNVILEYKRLKEERQKLDEQIELVLNKIQELNAKHSKVDNMLNLTTNNVHNIIK